MITISLWILTKQRRLCLTFGSEWPKACAQVSSYTYFGVFSDNSLTWTIHVDCLCSGWISHIIWDWHKGHVTACFGNFSLKLKNKLLRLTHTAWKIVGVEEHFTIQTIYEPMIQAGKITNGMSHILRGEYELLLSGRRYRLNKFKN